MDYIILEYLGCFLAVLGFATMPFFISVILMLAQPSLAYFSRSVRKAGSRISQLVVGFGGHALESGRKVSLGERVALKGTKVKDSSGNRSFKVQKPVKDYGACGQEDALNAALPTQ
jgi:hypothetical protein